MKIFNQNEKEKENDLTISVLVEKAESFFKLGDLIIGELIGHFFVCVCERLKLVKCVNERERIVKL